MFSREFSQLQMKKGEISSVIDNLLPHDLGKIN